QRAGVAVVLECAVVPHPVEGPVREGETLFQHRERDLLPLAELAPERRGVLEDRAARAADHDVGAELAGEEDAVHPGDAHQPVDRRLEHPRDRPRARLALEEAAEGLVDRVPLGSDAEPLVERRGHVGQVGLEEPNELAGVRRHSGTAPSAKMWWPTSHLSGATSWLRSKAVIC